MSRILITSALPYVNNVPHLGNIIGCVLSADIYARICRSLGKETLFVCATDEYGTATEKKARDEGLTPKEICDKYHAIHKRVYEAFDISFDIFGRTSHPEHIEVTQTIYQGLAENGYILEQASEQTYCETDQMFLADRFVEGTCPQCGAAGARGDQCDACGKLLQPTELLNPQCQICGNRPTQRTTTHLYLDLPKLEQELVTFRETSNTAGQWASNAYAVAKSWIERGLLPRPITRDLKWGVPVPRPGYENKVFYVWFDAPIGYISATKRGLPDTWETWWKNPQGVKLYQFMAKDNIPFHTVIFPASQIGSKQGWTLLHHINSTEYLNYENDKFSKSRGIGVFGTDVLDLEIPLDLWRFYLAFNRPEKSDSNFSWDGFLEDVNSNFIDNIGNLMNRVLVFFQKSFPQATWDAEFTARELDFLAEVKAEAAQAKNLMEAVQLREGLKAALALGRKGNKFFHDHEPWKEIKTDPPRAKALLICLAYLLRDLAILFSPYLPATSRRMFALLGLAPASLMALSQWQSLQGVTPGPAEILFPKLDAKQFQGYKERFQGKQEQRANPLEAFATLQIQVGEIVSIERHPEAERLYVETIDLGEGRHRTIVSGLVQHYQPAELLGKRVLVASNLKPANLRGVVSEGMVLACETKKKLEVLFTSAPIGTLAHLAGAEPTAAFQEITLDDFFKPGIEVKGHQMELAGTPVLLAGQAVKTEKIKDGKIA